MKTPIITIFCEDGAITGWDMENYDINLQPVPRIDVVDFDTDGVDNERICKCGISRTPHIHKVGIPT